ncbi:hypothetical protein PO124_23905 [Bacillus licheniformis]|nr:hypothetical protein [Bacillus licheniformis]
MKGGTYQASVYRRPDLRSGQRINGPAIVEQDDTTTLICQIGAGNRSCRKFDH